MSKQILLAAGFAPMEDRAVVHPRIILSLSGLEKQGKTHFGLTAPGPIAFFSTDVGEEGVLHKFPDKDILGIDIARVDEDEEDADETARQEFAKFRKAYRAALRSNWVRTLIIDTATEIWELLRIARFGRLTQVMPYMYGPVNKEYRDLIREAYDQDKNLILLHKMKSEYVNDKRTGEYVRSGFNDTGFLVQINAEIYRDEDYVFNLFITDCRQNADLAGEILEGDMATFPMLAQLALPESDPSVWE